MAYHYTIIIPHHNIPYLLKRCLSSIPHREDVQVIVVDDKSNANCLSVLQALEKEFDWTTFIYTKEGKGAGYVRNIGLNHAKGDYILFADADDFFNYCIDSVFDDYKNKDADIVFFNANSLDTDTYMPTYRCSHLNEMIETYKKHPDKAIFELKYAFGEPWCKMVKRKLIEGHGICFSETIIHNDTRYSYLVGFYSKNIYVDNRAIYCVTDRIGSVSKRISLDRLFTRTAVFAEANQFFKEHHINRFDERGLRPLLSFVVKGKLAHAKQCIRIMRERGMTTFSILLHCLFFPIYLLRKSKLAFKRVLLKFI